MNSKRLIFIVLISFNSIVNYAQHENEHNFDHPDVEFGVSYGWVHNFSEKESGPGIHIHFLKTVSKNDKFGLGFGYEAIFDEHKHSAASFLVIYRPVKPLFFIIAPGISWLGTEGDSLQPSFHIEGIYEWEFGNFHIGPMLSFALQAGDTHGTMGMHFAIGF